VKLQQLEEDSKEIHRDLEDIRGIVEGDSQLGDNLLEEDRQLEEDSLLVEDRQLVEDRGT